MIKIQPINGFICSNSGITVKKRAKTMCKTAQFIVNKLGVFNPLAP